MYLSKNFTLAEMTISNAAARLGIKNTPPSEAIKNLRLLCENVLQPLRDTLMRPVVVTSGYRCEAVNKAIRGAKGSQHLSGQAADLHVPGLRLSEVYDAILNLPFDQVIMEFGQWIHVSYSDTYNRGEKLIAKTENNKTVYTRI